MVLLLLLGALATAAAQGNNPAESYLMFLEEAPNSWLELSASALAPSGRIYFTMNTVNDSVFIFGGIGSSFLSGNDAQVCMHALTFAAGLITQAPILGELWSFSLHHRIWTPLRLNASSPGAPCVYAHTGIIYKVVL